MRCEHLGRGSYCPTCIGRMEIENADLLAKVERYRKALEVIRGGGFHRDCDDQGDGDGCGCAEAFAMQALAPDAKTRPDDCNHEWLDARNQHVQSGEVCLKCCKIRAGNETTDKRAEEPNK